MQLIQRTYQGSRDQERMMALVCDHPQDNFHIIDLPYRFSSWAFDNPANVSLWEDEQGELLAWAVLQTPFWTLDYAYHPAAPATLPAQLLAWADQQAHANLASVYGRPLWFVNVFDWQTQRQRDLETQGFVSVADWVENPWTKVLLHHQPTHPLTVQPLPDGYTLRPLRGVQEVAAYVALHRAVFESESMTTAWRERTLLHPAYQPQMDLVIEDAAGKLAAFCVCWFAPNGIKGRPSGQIEPLGVRADQRQHGLGRAILSEGVRRLYAQGAEHVVVETDNYRNAAFTLYESVGFQVQENVLVYRKDYTNNIPGFMQAN
ncbi:MAG: N-acetyltransferase [Caldilineaceae bacterium]